MGGGARGEVDDGPLFILLPTSPWSSFLPAFYFFFCIAIHSPFVLNLAVRADAPVLCVVCRCVPARCCSA